MSVDRPVPGSQRRTLATAAPPRRGMRASATASLRRGRARRAGDRSRRPRGAATGAQGASPAAGVHMEGEVAHPGSPARPGTCAALPQCSGGTPSHANHITDIDDLVDLFPTAKYDGRCPIPRRPPGAGSRGGRRARAGIPGDHRAAPTRTEDRAQQRSHAMESYKLFLNGQWHAGSGVLKVVDPATDQVFAEVATIDRAGVRQALDDAHAAFAGWRRAPRQGARRLPAAIAGRARRAPRRDRPHDHARERQAAGAEPGRGGDDRRSPALVRRGGAPGLRSHCPEPGGRQAAPGGEPPIGVVGAISAVELPAGAGVRKIAPALAAGCPVVLKPASATPLCAVDVRRVRRRRRAAARASSRSSSGRRPRSATSCSTNPLCRKITLHRLDRGRPACSSGAPRQQVQPLSLELGGHAPVLVFADADLDAGGRGRRSSPSSATPASRASPPTACYVAAADLRPVPRGAGGAGAGAEGGQTASRRAWTSAR